MDLNVAQGRARARLAALAARAGAARRRPRGRMAGFLAAAAACLALGMLLVACGGEEEGAGAKQTTADAVTGADGGDASKAPGSDAPEDEPSDDPLDDETAIKATLDKVLTGVEPAMACGDLVTDRYLRRSFGDRAGCEAAQRDLEAADSAGVSQVVILPDSVAQALAKPRGGLYGGDRLRAELVLGDGVWKLDSLRSNVPVGP